MSSVPTSAFPRDKRPLIAVAFLTTLALVLAFAGSASASRPGFYSAPSVALGDKVVGSTLVASDGALNCEPACEPAGPTPERAGRFFQWLVCDGPHGGGRDVPPGGQKDEGGPCPGAVIVKPKVRIQSDPNANRYTVRPEDAGKYIQVEVIAVNLDCTDRKSDGTHDCAYSEGHGWSSTFGPIAGSAQPPAPPPPPPPPPAVAPTYTALPSIVGDAEDMATLTVANGTWNGTAPLAYAYQWLRCSRANQGCKPIEGATTAEYTVTGADVATRLTAQVTVSNAGGQFVAVAPLTRKIAGAKPRPGRDSLTAAQLLPRHRLRVREVTFTPRLLRPGARWTARVEVTDRRGFLIEGVEVDVADELGDVTAASVLTDSRGIATVRLRTTRFVPLGRLVLTVTATKPVGEAAIDAEAQSVTKRVAVRVRR
jgi:hypothetical protein